MYRTADNLEDLDIKEELKSFYSIGDIFVKSEGGFWNVDEEYQDADFFLIMINDSEEEEIRTLLQSGLWSAWLEYLGEDGLKMVKI